MPILEQDKMGIRRHLGYNVVGLYRQSPAGGTLAPASNTLRFFQDYGNLEYRMNNLLPVEECALIGHPYGAIGFVNSGVAPQAGSVITVTLTSAAFSVSPRVYTYTVLPTDTLLTICGQLALLAASDGVFTSAGFYAINDYGNGPYSFPANPNIGPSMPLVSYVAPTAATIFSITTTGTGNTIPQVIANGIPLPPTLTSNLTFPPTILYGFLPICNYLEDKWNGTSDNLDTYKGNDAILRMNELEKREKQYKNWCLQMARFLAIPIFPDNPATNRGYPGSGGTCAAL